MVTALLLKSINKALEMSILIRGWPLYLNICHILKKLVLILVSNVWKCLDTRWLMWEGNFCRSKALSVNFIFYQTYKSRCYALQATLSHLSHCLPQCDHNPLYRIPSQERVWSYFSPLRNITERLCKCQHAFFFSTTVCEHVNQALMCFLITQRSFPIQNNA